MSVEYLLKNTVPYYNVMKAGLKSINNQKANKKKFKKVRLTKINKNGEAELVKGVTVEQVINKLANYENSGLSPHELTILIEREKNLSV